MLGNEIYAIEIDFTNVSDHGVSLDELLSGTKAPPPCGARIDVGFEGSAEGRVNGKIRGTDFINVRADGRFELNIRATVETADGARIAVEATGIAVPRANEPVADLRESVKLSCSDERYLWVNGVHGWGHGTVDLAKGHVSVQIFG